MDHAPGWMRALEPRELGQVYHALAYAKDYSSAGVPGHNHIMLIAKLAGLLDKPTAVVWKHAHWDEADKCWRDTETGVKVPAPPVDHSLLTPAEPIKFDPTRAPDVSKKPGGFA